MFFRKILDLYFPFWLGREVPTQTAAAPGGNQAEWYNLS